MLNRRDIKSVLIINKPLDLAKNNFYRNLFKVPEVLNRLRQYREILYKNDIEVPLWIYCITQEIKTLLANLQPEIVCFLVNLGLFDRLISKQGWPNYLLGSSSVVSVISNEISFEDRCLLLAKEKSFSETEDVNTNTKDGLILLKADSYYDTKTEKFLLTNLKTKLRSLSFEDGIKMIEKYDIDCKRIYQFLSPHKGKTLDDLLSLDIRPMDFLEADQDLKWLWPSWKKTQMNAMHNSTTETLLN